MTEVIVGATVSVIGSVLVVTIGHIYAVKKEIQAKWRDIRVEQYREFMCATSDLASEGQGKRRIDADYRFGRAMNMISLVGSDEVVKFANRFFRSERIQAVSDEEDEAYSIESEQAFHELVNAMRCDVGGKDYLLPAELDCSLYRGFARHHPVETDDDA